MIRYTLTTSLLLLPLLVTAGTPAAPTALQAAVAKNPKAPVQAVSMEAPLTGWTLGAGIIWRQLGEVSFGSGHYSGAGSLPAAQSRSSGGGYSDGYVQPDITGSATQTWNWGYNNASQVVGNTLVFSGSSSQLTQQTQMTSLNSGGSEELEGVGVEFSVESPVLLRWQQFTLSAAMGYSFVTDEADQTRDAWQARRTTWLRQSSVRDVYDISAIAPIPPAHQGNFNGPGPVISTTPISSTGGGSSDREKLHDDVYASSVSQSLDLRLHTLSFGPQIALATPRVQFLGSLGLALNIADYEAEYDERLTVQRDGGSKRTLQHWQASDSGTEVIPGFYLEATAELPLNRRWSAYMSGRYDWAGSVEGRIGPSYYDVDLSGWTLGIGVLYRF